MNGKARVLAVLNGEIPDRVPMGEFAVDFDTVEKILGHETYLRAKAKSQIAFWEGRHDEVAQSYREDHIALHEKLDLDIVTFPDATWFIPVETNDPPPRRVAENTWEDHYGRVYKYSDITADITCITDPVAENQVFSVDEFTSDPTPPVIDPRSMQIANTVITRFKDEKFICGPNGGEIGMILLGGMARGLMEMIDHPGVVEAATTFTVQQQHLADESLVHPDADGILWGIDLAHQNGPFISPRMFRRFFFEANRARVEHMHQRGKKVIKHCCGNTNQLLDMFVEIGYDAYQSIQHTAGVDICAVKQTHGDRLTLWGGVPVESIMGGTPAAVREHVRRAMACAKPGGRFILGTSHSIAVGSIYDNYLAMLDEYHKLCAY